MDGRLPSNVDMSRIDTGPERPPGRIAAVKAFG